MPRQASLSTLGALHHVTVRGLERGGMPHECRYEPLVDNLPSGDRAR